MLKTIVDDIVTCGRALRVRVKFSLGVRVSGMIMVRVDVEVRVRNLLGSD